MEKNNEKKIVAQAQEYYIRQFIQTTTPTPQSQQQQPFQAQKQQETTETTTTITQKPKFNNRTIK